MKTMIYSAMLAALAINVGVKAHAAEPRPQLPTVVVVHGAFDDGSSWNKVTALLQAKGLKVVSVQNPLTSLVDDVAATWRALDDVPGPVVLVGHSWGGAVISEVGGDARVKSLVYVAAFAPSEGQSVADLGKGYPQPPGADFITKDNAGYLRLNAEGMRKHFAQDLPPGTVRSMTLSQGPISAGSFDEKVVTAAWRTRPSWYVLTEHDHMIDPGLQKAMAEKISAHIVSVPTSHVPQLARPAQVANAIAAAAAGAAE
ncbi:alpha/beta hydrolase [Variovorax sp. J22P240]|uniref:alpha/beta fold hydrolase n=1 Tax=Variovorax sp. J22P240 TaxID=3053514 RepID=UPI002574F353|nr:alpha/beta hydrolase [Variovorax sp. J22P240]MDM0001238.1 alpha/beta hydrolase [Variovorax sp. J22P240]